MVERRRVRSDQYQHLILEIAHSNDMMEHYSNHDSISHRLNPFQYDEELLLLEDELKKEFWRLVNDNLTERQREILELSAQGKTQCEIAKQLNVNQSSITKSLNGNIDYKKIKKEQTSTKPTTYGGSKKKLLRIIEKDEKIKSILDRMIAIRMERW